MKKNTFQEFWKTISQSWKLFLVFLSLLISLGVFKIDAISVQIPPEWIVPLILSVLLIGFVIAFIVAITRLSKIDSDLQSAKTEITELKSRAPELFVEDVPIQGLVAHVAKRVGKPINNVHLDQLSLSVYVHGEGIKRDATMVWRISGINSTNERLANMHISIAGETLLPLAGLKCEIFDIEKDPNRTHKIMPLLVGEDGTNKNLLLPFLSPGIDPHKRFDLEFKYSWKAIVNVLKDYWFIDPSNYATSVANLKFTIFTESILFGAAYAFKLDIKSYRAEFQGSLPISTSENAQEIKYEVDSPSRGSFYIIVVEGNTSIRTSI